MISPSSPTVGSRIDGFWFTQFTQPVNQSPAERAVTQRSYAREVPAGHDGTNALELWPSSLSESAALPLASRNPVESIPSRRFASAALPPTSRNPVESIPSRRFASAALPPTSRNAVEFSPSSRSAFG